MSIVFRGALDFEAYKKIKKMLYLKTVKHESYESWQLAQDSQRAVIDYFGSKHANMAELVDAGDSKSPV